MTAAVQWMERTLDDSANRRISMPEGFLCADAILRLCNNVTRGLVVNEKIIDKTVREYLPFIATENLMMEAVKRGGDRQELHEVIRRCSLAASAKMKEGEPCDLLRRLAAEVEAARHLGIPAMKLIHGYGSSGRGGRLRTACRTWLRQQELCFLPGEEFTIFNEEARRWLAVCPRLRQDRDLDAENRGVTFVLLKK